MGKHRSIERLSVIDSTLRQQYPVNGAEYCANELSENIGYIKIRAYYLGLKLNEDLRTKQRSKTSSTMKRKAYATRTTERKDKGVERGVNKDLVINKLKEDNKLLRKELLKLTMTNKKLRKVIGGQ